MPVACGSSRPSCPRAIVTYQGDTYIAALRDTVDGIQIAALTWE
jgi:hypothetical protein